MTPRPNSSVQINLNRKRTSQDLDIDVSNKKICGNYQIRVKRSNPEGNHFKKMIRLFDAVIEGDMETVQELIQETGPAVRNIKTHCTLLHTAAENGQSHFVVFLLKHISPNVINKNKQTPAHLAALNGHIKSLKIILADNEMNPNQRDEDQQTYKDMLVAPLFKAVLWWNKTQIQELLSLGANPDSCARNLVDGTLSRELKVTTPRELAQALGRQAITNMFPEKRIPDLTNHQSLPTSSHYSIFDPTTVGPLRLNVKPTAQPISGSDIYKPGKETNGYVCILNYGSFQGRPDLDLEASEDDSNNLADLFRKMGYKSEAHNCLSADQTKNVLTNIREMQSLNETGCVIFIISSHSSGNDGFITSDMNELKTDWVFNLFQDAACPQLKGKPKLFIFDFCQGYYIKDATRPTRPFTAMRVQEPLQDMMCVYSNSSGFNTYAFSKDGSTFNTAFCRTLAKHSHDKELYDLYRELLTEYRKVSPSAVPQMRNIGFTRKFYFNPRPFPWL